MRRGGGPHRYHQVWANLKARAPEHHRMARARRQTAEQLMAELFNSPPKIWRSRILGEVQFHSQDLLERLLEVCHGALPFEPRRAAEVSKVALDLGHLLGQKAPNTAAVESMCRALCLGGHALRLLGDHQQADGLLARVAMFTADPSGRGFFCRAYALLRWDQGRTEEAEALLLQAHRRYQELEDVGEEGVCAALLGLLYCEVGDWDLAETALLKARSALVARQSPWLSAHADLALARCHALANRKAEAQELRQTVSSLYPSVPIKEALVSLLWREAQAAEALGDLAEAGRLLGAVRRSYLDRRCLPEATLTTLQLSWVLACQGRTGETVALAAKLKEVFREHPGFDVSWGALQRLSKETARARQEDGGFMYPTLFLSYRALGVYPQPVPFL
jgi:tetratricopeptide (TPR) repeat protein